MFNDFADMFAHGTLERADNLSDTTVVGSDRIARIFEVTTSPNQFTRHDRQLPTFGFGLRWPNAKGSRRRDFTALSDRRYLPFNDPTVLRLGDRGADEPITPTRERFDPALAKRSNLNCQITFLNRETRPCGLHQFVL